MGLRLYASFVLHPNVCRRCVPVKATIKNTGGMSATTKGDLSAFGAPEVGAKQIETVYRVGKQKIGYCRFTRLTNATYLFELNVKGEKVALTYTIGEGHE